MPRLLLLLFCLCLPTAWHCAAPDPPGAEQAVARPVGRAASFPMSDRFQLQEFRGKVVLLNFWATWCPPCKAEVPDLIRLRNEFSQEQLALIGISMDQAPVEDLQPKMHRFVDQYRINYPVFLDPEYALARAYGGFAGIPTTFLIDQRGQTVRTYAGAQPFDVFARDVRGLLGGS